jgi:hypothetical protein
MYVRQFLQDDSPNNLEDTREHNVITRCEPKCIQKVIITTVPICTEKMYARLTICARRVSVLACYYFFTSTN